MLEFIDFKALTSLYMYSISTSSPVNCTFSSLDLESLLRLTDLILSGSTDLVFYTSNLGRGNDSICIRLVYKV